MSDNNSSGGSKLLTGMAIGALAGLVAGLLFAPKSGKETRDDIKSSAKKAKLSAENAVNKLRDEINSLIEKAEPKISKLKSQAKQQAADLVEQAKMASAKARDVMSAFRSGNATDEDLQAAIKNAQEAKSRLNNFIKKS